MQQQYYPTKGFTAFIPALDRSVDEDVTVVIALAPLDISGLDDDDDDAGVEGSGTAEGEGRISPATTVAIWVISS